MLTAGEWCGGLDELADQVTALLNDEDPQPAYDFYIAAMIDLAELSPNAEISQAHLVIATTTLDQFVAGAGALPPDVESAADYLRDEQDQRCPG